MRSTPEIRPPSSPHLNRRDFFTRATAITVAGAATAESGLKVAVTWRNGAYIDCARESCRVRATFAGPGGSCSKFHAAYLE